ncbi:phage NrS-1 polymerase family protein [Erysipelothrix piscisicarius]|uniref:phage NrS-1 polymerase family protein n=1 Tax=Erysipelothrix piscisicarius TaxID=2485784 RepID=UPI0038994FAF
MDRLFRRSCLFREKWDSMRGRDTYGKVTILKSLKDKKEFYTPVLISNAPKGVLFCSIKFLTFNSQIFPLRFL